MILALNTVCVYNTFEMYVHLCIYTPPTHGYDTQQHTNSEAIKTQDELMMLIIDVLFIVDRFGCHVILINLVM